MDSVESEGKLELPKDIPEPISSILQNYNDIFRTPTHLPPKRVIDHKIHLMLNTVLVNKLVQEMLDQGIIRMS